MPDPLQPAGKCSCSERRSSSIIRKIVGNLAPVLIAAFFLFPLCAFGKGPPTPTPNPTPSPYPSAVPTPTITGTTYYVDPINGSDGNSGTSSNSAWKSLGKVQTFLNSLSLRPGDGILFARGGSWTGGLTIPPGINGSSTAPVSFGNYGTGALPIIDGGSKTNACFYARATGTGATPLWSYLTISGFECRNTTQYGVLFYQNAGGSAGMPGIVIENMYVHNTGPKTDDGQYRNQVMFLDENIAPDGVQVLANAVGNCGGHNCIQVQRDIGNPVVRGNTCYGAWNHNCIDLKGVVGAVVAGNTVYGPTRSGSAFYIENTEVPAADITWELNVTHDSPNGFECEGGGTAGSQSVTCRAYNNTGYLVNQSVVVTGSDCSQPISWDIRSNILDSISPYYQPYSCTNRSIVWNYNDDCASQGACSSSYTIKGINDLAGVNPNYVSVSTYNYQLRSGSACIGAGDPTVSPITSNSNMGAY